MLNIKIKRMDFVAGLLMAFYNDFGFLVDLILG